MRRLRTCGNCSHGIRTQVPNVVDELDNAVICALAPPVLQPDGGYHRPMMKPLGWCGQFKVSLSKLLSRSYG